MTSAVKPGRARQRGFPDSSRKRNAAIAVFLAGLAIAPTPTSPCPARPACGDWPPCSCSPSSRCWGGHRAVHHCRHRAGCDHDRHHAGGDGQAAGGFAGPFIAVVGLIIVLGPAWARWPRAPAPAEQLVRAIVRRIGLSNRCACAGHHGDVDVDLRRAGHAGGRQRHHRRGGDPDRGRGACRRRRSPRCSRPRARPARVLGPFTPNVVTVLGLTGLSYPGVPDGGRPADGRRHAGQRLVHVRPHPEDDRGAAPVRGSRRRQPRRSTPVRRAAARCRARRPPSA